MKKIYAFVAIILLTTACTNFVDPIVPFTNVESGTYLKTITTTPAINFYDIDNSPFSLLLECHAAGKVNNVKTVDIMVNHRRGSTVTKETLLGTIEGSSFTVTPDSEWPRASVKYTMDQVLTKIGFSKTNIRPADILEYKLVLTTLDGKTFSTNNMSGNLSDTYYASPFFYRASVVCPTSLEGTYDYTTTDITGSVADGANPAACGTGVSGKVTIAKTTVAGEYSVSDGTFGQYGCAWNDNPATGSIRFTDACGKIGMKGQDSYGLTYGLTYIKHTNTELTFKWFNDFGDSGITTLKRSSGTWPASLN